MVPRYVNAWLNGELQLNRRIEIASDAGGLLTIDGMRGMGQSVTHQAMEVAIARARERGVVVMGLRNSHHLGRVGHWAEQACAAGLVSVHFTNAVSKGAMVAPHGGTQARFLTNPFTVGIPRASGEPVVLDFATSAIAHGKARVAYNKGVRVPPGSLLDANGQPTDDPAVMFEPPEGPHGALRTFAAHKGYALAMVCELLGAALTGGETCQPAHFAPQWAIWNNMLTILFDPARVGSGERFESEARGFVEWVKSSPLAEGFEHDEILMPGDPERIARRERAQAVPIDGETLAQLDAASAAVARARGQSPGPCSALERGC